MIKTGGLAIYRLSLELPMERGKDVAIDKIMSGEGKVREEAVLQEFLTDDRKEYIFTDGEFSGQDEDTVVAICKYIINKRTANRKADE